LLARIGRHAGIFSQGDFAALYVREPIAWKMFRGCDTDVCFGSLADISQCNRHVRFTPEADILGAERDVRFCQKRTFS